MFFNLNLRVHFVGIQSTGTIFSLKTNHSCRTYPRRRQRDRPGPAAAVRVRDLRLWLRAQGGPAQKGENHARVAAQVRHHHHLRRAQTAPHAGMC